MSQPTLNMRRAFSARRTNFDLPFETRPTAGTRRAPWMVICLLFASGFSVCRSFAQVMPSDSKPNAAATAPVTRTPMMPRRAAAFYEGTWGVDLLSVRAVESGELIRFSYHILDPGKAASLNDKKLEPALIFPDGHAKLVIPSLEKVGQLRQSSEPIAGKSYWMAFSNPSRTVKRGDRVDIVIGQFHAEGLVVE